MAKVTENVIRTVIDFATRGGKVATREVDRLSTQLNKLQSYQKGQLRVTGILTPKREKLIESYRKQRGVIESLAMQQKKQGELLRTQEKYMTTQITGLSKLRNEIVGTVSAKKKFREEMTRLQRRTKTFPRDIRALSAQQSLLNRAQQRGTIQMAEYKRKIEPVNKALTKLEGKTGRTIAKQFQWAIGWYTLYRIIRTVIGGIGSVIRAYMDLENEMARVSTVTRAMGDTKENVMKRLRKAVLEYTSRSIRSFKEVAEVMYHLGSAGLTVGQQLTGFKHILDLTTGTLGNVRQVARLVAGSFNVFGRHLKNLTSDSEKFRYISDLLAFTYHNQQVELSEIASAMTLVGSAGALIDIDFKVLIGTIGELNTGMLKGTRAGTSLMNSFIKIAQNSDKLGKILGITFHPDLPLNFVDVMRQLHDRFGDMALTTAGLKDLMQVFGLRGARAVGAIINNFKKWEKTVKTTDKTFEGFAKSMRKQIEDTLPRQIKILGNLLQKEIIDRLTGVGAKNVIKYLNEQIELSQKISVIAKHYGETREYLLGLDKEIIDRLFEKVRLEKTTADIIKESKADEAEISALQRARIELMTKEDELIATVLPKIKDMTDEEQKRVIEAIKIMNLSKTAKSLLNDILEVSKDITDEKNKEAKNEKARQVAIATNIARIVEERQREERIRIMKRKGLAEELIMEEEILALYYKGLGDAKEKVEEAHQLLGIQALLLEDEEQLIEIARQIKNEKGEMLINIEEIETREQLLIAILRAQQHTWTEIEAIIKKIMEHDVPSEIKGWQKGIESLKDPIKDMFKLLVGGAEDWGEAWRQIGADVTTNIGDMLADELTKSLTGAKGLFGKLATLPEWVAGPIGAIVGGLFGGLASLFTSTKKEQEKIREATLDVSAGIDISNEQLAIVNRNLLDIRHAMEGYPMAESYYFRQRPGAGVNVQGIYITMPEGSDGDDVVNAIKEAVDNDFSLSGSSVYQPS